MINGGHDYDYFHLPQMHRFIFQGLYDWAGQQRKVNIYKEEAVLGGLSIDYSDVFDIARDAEKVLSDMRHKKWEDMSLHEKAVQFSDSLARVWKIHPFREGNTRTTVTFCCQYADEVGLNPNREIFEDNAWFCNQSQGAYKNNSACYEFGDCRTWRWTADGRG